jgi:hypothetical protein
MQSGIASRRARKLATTNHRKKGLRTMLNIRKPAGLVPAPHNTPINAALDPVWHGPFMRNLSELERSMARADGAYLMARAA